MNGQIMKTGHISHDHAPSFFSNLTRITDEYQSAGLSVEIQYQPLIQLNGQALFTAVILGRKQGD